MEKHNLFYLRSGDCEGIESPASLVESFAICAVIKSHLYHYVSTGVDKYI
jgi:hypothetical protein